MKYLIFDAETSGLFDYALPADDPAQPRLAEFCGFIVRMTGDGAIVHTSEPFEFLVKPEGWEMQREAQAITGLTTEYLMEHGRDVRDVLAWYSAQIEDGAIVSTYNAQHDCKTMRGELRRAGMPDLFEQTKNSCMMRSCQKLGVKKESGKGGWPKLSDACRHFNITPEGEVHRARSGAECALALFFAMHEGGHLIEPSVHYAKNKPLPDNQNKMEF